MSITDDNDAERSAQVVTPVLSPGGFAFEVTGSGNGSGGSYARARLIRPGQYVEFHVRHSLGHVTHGSDGQVLSHQNYLRSVGAAGGYPAYGSGTVGAPGSGCGAAGCVLAGPGDIAEQPIGLSGGSGRREEALAAIEQAVAIRRVLAEALTAVFAAGLAGSLELMADLLASSGLEDRAAEAVREAGRYASRPER